MIVEPKAKTKPKEMLVRANLVFGTRMSRLTANCVERTILWIHSEWIGDEII